MKKTNNINTNPINKGEIKMTNTKYTFKTKIIAGVLTVITVITAMVFTAIPAYAAEASDNTVAAIVTVNNEEKSFDSFTDAFAEAAAANEATVKLNANIDGIHDLTVPAGKNIKVDLDGHILNANGNLFTTDGGASLTVKNGYIQYAETAFIANGEINLNGVTVTASKNSAVRVADGVKAVITGCTFSGNSGDRGGAIYMPFRNYGTVIRNNTFTGNCSEKEGGAIYTPNPIRNCRFYENTAGTDGGAIYFTGKNESIKDNSFEKNLASGNGGAVVIAADFGGIYSSTFNDNTARGDGGAIYTTDDNDAVVFANKIYNNSATNGGGIYVSDHSLLTLSSTKIYDNSALHNGGGIFLGSLSTKDHNFTDCEITGNRAQTAGGVYADAGAAKAADIEFLGKVIIKDNWNDDLYLVKSCGKKAKVYPRSCFEINNSCVFVNSSESGERAVAELSIIGQEAAFHANGGRSLERGYFFDTTLYIE